MRSSDTRSCQPNRQKILEASSENNLVGYARVSTNDQNLSLQLDELKAHGCQRIFTDKASGAKHKRQGLDECLNSLSDGDVLVVWKLDRLGRSLPHLVSIVSSLKEKGIGFKSLHDEAINTTTPSGELIFHIFAALSSYELALIRERTRAGLKAARARGRVGGRPKTSTHDPLVLAVKRMYQDAFEIKEICEKLNLSESTVYRYNRLEDDNEKK